MAFRGQMHDQIGLKTSEKVANCFRVSDIRPSKAIASMILYRLQRIETTSVGQLVDHKDMIVRGGNQMPHHG